MKACHAAAIRPTDPDSPRAKCISRKYLGRGLQPSSSKHLPAGKRGHFEARNFGHTEERARATLVKERLAAAACH